MRVLHFSDIHVGASPARMPLQDWLGKRAIGRLNLLRGRGRLFRDGRAKLEALARFQRAQRVDLVIFSGDYTALGLESEFEAARQAVQPFMAAPLGFVNVPGNHDVYLADALRQRRFERHFGDTLGTDLPEHRADGSWPLVRLVGPDLAAVAVNSARPNLAPWRSSGRIPDLQLSALRRLLDDERVRTRFVFVVTHYAPRLRDGRPDSRAHGLDNAGDFLAACAGLARGAILCGHVHHAYQVRVEGVRAPIFCAGSAVMAGREGAWLFEAGARTVVATPVRWRDGGFVLLADSAVAA